MWQRVEGLGFTVKVLKGGTSKWRLLRAMLGFSIVAHVVGFKALGSYIVYFGP